MASWLRPHCSPQVNIYLTQQEVGSNDTTSPQKSHHIQSLVPAIMKNWLCVGLGISRCVAFPLLGISNHKGNYLVILICVGLGISCHVAITLLCTSDHKGNMLSIEVKWNNLNLSIHLIQMAETLSYAVNNKITN